MEGLLSATLLARNEKGSTAAPERTPLNSGAQHRPAKRNDPAVSSKATGGLPQRLSLVTLGVADVARSRAFYERLGFQAADFQNEAVVFFAMSNGVALALFGRQPLAEDANVPHMGDGFRGVTCAINLASEVEVDAALTFAESCGGRITKPAQKVFWGGYSGYFADPDGHLWEVAYNPFFPVSTDGRVSLPPPKNEDGS